MGGKLIEYSSLKKLIVLLSQQKTRNRNEF